MLVGACHGSPARDLGDDLEGVVDLPAQDPWPGAASDCVDPLPCLVGPSVAGGVEIVDAVDLESLAEIRCIAGSLTIEGTMLRDLSGLEALERVCGWVRIADNPELETLRGLDALAHAAYITIADNPRLTALALPSLAEGSLRLERLDAMVDLSSLDALESGTVSVFGCNALTSFGPLVAFERGGLASEENAALVGFEVPRLIDGSIRSTRDPALVELRLPAVVSASTIEVEDAPKFATLDAPLLTSLDVLSLRRNAALVDVPVLPMLGSVGRIDVSFNPALTSLAGAEALASASAITFVRNEALMQDYAEQVAAALGGSAKVAGNFGWEIPTQCPFLDGICDAIGCGDTEVCSADSDFDDCCTCTPEACPFPGS